MNQQMKRAAIALGLLALSAGACQAAITTAVFPPALDSYGEAPGTSVGAILWHRVQAEPFNLVASVIFLLAIVHTFLCPKIVHFSRGMEKHPIAAALFHFLGEVEVVFGLWAVPLAIALAIDRGPAAVRTYFDQTIHFTQPLFVVVVMAIAATSPIVNAAAWFMGLLAGKSVARWWFVVLTVGPLFGSFITEPAAMTLCALLLAREFYECGPSLSFRYVTLGLLFVNVSVGGAFTPFAAPPILMVAQTWHWGLLHPLHHFGLRVLPALLISNTAYYLIFRGEFARLQRARAAKAAQVDSTAPVPRWITLVHFAFLAWTILVADDPPLFIGAFLFFLGFTIATPPEFGEVVLRPPLLVGFFLAGLVVHGGFQGWWIQPVLSHLHPFALLVGATILTSFNDNAAITYLASLVPHFSDALKDAVVSGAICGGGLTVIANAPNPAGQSLLREFFPEGSVAPGKLFLAALPPTLVLLVFFAWR